MYFVTFEQYSSCRGHCQQNNKKGSARYCYKVYFNFNCIVMLLPQASNYFVWVSLKKIRNNGPFNRFNFTIWDPKTLPKMVMHRFGGDESENLTKSKLVCNLWPVWVISERDPRRDDVDWVSQLITILLSTETNNWNAT